MLHGLTAREKNPEAIASYIGSSGPRSGSKHPHDELETPGAGRLADEPPSPDLVEPHGAGPARGAQPGPRQAMIPRPRHDLHRTLHCRMDWWVAADAPFEERALQIGKLGKRKIAVAVHRN